MHLSFSVLNPDNLLQISCPEHFLLFCKVFLFSFAFVCSPLQDFEDLRGFVAKSHDFYVHPS